MKHGNPLKKVWIDIRCSYTKVWTETKDKYTTYLYIQEDGNMIKVNLNDLVIGQIKVLSMIQDNNILEN